jgi:hypothetical protein
MDFGVKLLYSNLELSDLGNNKNLAQVFAFMFSSYAEALAI